MLSVERTLACESSPEPLNLIIRRFQDKARELASFQCRGSKILGLIGSSGISTYDLIDINGGILTYLSRQNQPYKLPFRQKESHKNGKYQLTQGQ